MFKTLWKWITAERHPPTLEEPEVTWFPVMMFPPGVTVAAPNATPESKQRCDRCRHWSRIGKGEVYEKDGTVFSDDGFQVEEGECRRFPPVISSDVLGRIRKESGYANKFYRLTPKALLRVASVFPVTFAWNSCGEWLPCRDVPQKKEGDASN